MIGEYFAIEYTDKAKGFYKWKNAGPKLYKEIDRARLGFKNAVKGMGRPSYGDFAKDHAKIIKVRLERVE